MKTATYAFSGLALITLVSCNAPYGNGIQPLTPRVSVEEVERQAPLPPAPENGFDGYTAAQYGLDNRFGGFHGFGRPTTF